MQSALRLSALSLLILAACASGSNDGTDRAVGPVLDLRVVHPLPRGVDSTASIHTLPNAACTLRAPGEAPGAVEHLRLYSDDDGIARLHLQWVDPASDHGQLLLDCVDDTGAQVTHTIDVRVDDLAQPQAPAPYAKDGKRVLPALDVDPASLDRQELLARGYPPMPDATSSPARYAQWLDLVSRRPTVIEPHRVTDPSRTHATGSSTNWSGYVITTPPSGPKYGEVFGSWSVPRVATRAAFFSQDYSSLWVGMDGWGSADSVQAGTDQNAESSVWLQTSSYGAWTQFLPAASQAISNFPVNPGDQVDVWAWVASESDVWGPSGNTAWFLFWNRTQNLTTSYMSSAAPSGTTFAGHSAEWVMERPLVAGKLPTLANYATAEISDAWVYDYAGKEHYYASDTSLQLSMFNGGDLLSSVAPVDPMTMQFTWHDYQ